ncbi:MAG: hypothetical protein A3E38_02155 [Candidatus Moranbacteria bacterium RIFCSPHIGHO2_12_FULL_54_9]|nr:MAG: hypothetical protein A2878_01925 [Candidatus Moranbacteria bacterium RIFCSPHIGHO2_01_FULL_54_31]OGI25266.1 MAG: hypothetical protein A3E38_02155 [Candidatus Moranbacteria bacterium RIFCSPHIGHO2_12_FULL_54_9]
MATILTEKDYFQMAQDKWDQCSIVERLEILHRVRIQRAFSLRRRGRKIVANELLCQWSTKKCAQLSRTVRRFIALAFDGQDFSTETLPWLSWER